MCVVVSVPLFMVTLCLLCLIFFQEGLNSTPTILNRIRWYSLIESCKRLVNVQWLHWSPGSIRCRTVLWSTRRYVDSVIQDAILLVELWRFVTSLQRRWKFFSSSRSSPPVLVVMVQVVQTLWCRKFWRYPLPWRHARIIL